MTPENLMSRIYAAEKRIKHLRSVIGPDSEKDIVIERNVAHLKSLWDQLEKQFHLSGEDYKKFVDVNWMKIEGAELMADRSGRCLVNMRWLLKHDPITDPIPCQAKNCFDCPDFDEATEEQELDFLHGLDV